MYTGNANADKKPIDRTAHTRKPHALEQIPLVHLNLHAKLTTTET